MDEEIAFVKGALRALLISSGKSRMSLKELAAEFAETEGQTIPYSKFGFRTVLDFARSISDVLQLHGRPDGPDVLVSVVSNASVSHVQQLVAQSKKSNKSKKSVLSAHKSWNTGVNVGKNLSYKQQGKLPNQSAKRPASTTPTTAYKYHKNQQQQYTGCTITDLCLGALTSLASSIHLPQKHTRGQNKPATGGYRSPKKSPIQNRISQPAPKVMMTMDWINCLNVPLDVMGLGSLIEKPQIERFLKPNTKQPVRVLSIVNPNRMWITTASLLSVNERMMNDLQRCYGDPATGNRWNFQPSHVCFGLFCAAHWRDKWHRAQIVGPLQFGSMLVKLRFIDFGRTEVVHLSSIKYLGQYFQSFPESAIRASLAYLKPREYYWNRNHVHCLQSLLSHATHTAYIVDANPSTQVVDIILYDPTGSKNINHLFAKSVNGKWQDHNPEKFQIVHYRNRVKCYCECHPSFLEIEAGKYPSVSEMELSFLRGFDYEGHYAQCVHNEVMRNLIFQEQKLTSKHILVRSLSATNPFAPSQ